MMDQFECTAIVRAETDKAVKVDLALGPWHMTGRWVPRSVLHADNEANHVGDTGQLVVALWWAVQEGLQPCLQIPSSSLAVQQAVDAILAVMEYHAHALENRTQYEDALCDCGRCGLDVVGYHQAEVLRFIARLIRERV